MNLRKWVGYILERLELLTAAVGPGGGPAALGNAWADNPNQATLVNTGAIIVAQATITPRVTGKLRVIITGTVNNTDGVAVSLITTVSQGVSSTPALYTQGTAETPASPDSGTVALVVDLDKTASPTVFPVGTPVNINAVLQAGVGNVIVVPAHGVQIEVQERLN